MKLGRTILIAAVVAAGLAALPARLQAAGSAIPAQQATLYFGLKSADGVGVSEQQWQRFLADVVTPRFPDGLTVVNAYGQGSAAATGPVVAETTKVLIIVHPETPEAAAALAAIKAEYSRRFGRTGVFHTEAAVSIVP